MGESQMFQIVRREQSGRDIGNRVADILETRPVGCWHHVRGTENPADCASRGMFPSLLAQYELWWHGPLWLKIVWRDGPPETEFPEHPIPYEEKDLPQNVSAAQPVYLPLLKKYLTTIA